MSDNSYLHKFYTNIITNATVQVVDECNGYESKTEYLILVDIVTNKKWVLHKSDMQHFFVHITLEEAIKLLPKPKPKKKRRKRCHYCGNLREDRLIDIIDDTNFTQQKICIDCWNEKFEPITKEVDER